MKNILNWRSFNESYNKPRAGGKRRWSVKYKRKINCSNPKGFSQVQFCKRKRRGGHYKTESVNNDSIRQTLNDIFLEVSDNTNWSFSISSINQIHEQDYIGNYCEVYIFHGNEEGDEIEQIGYQQREIPKELVGCIESSIDFMDNEGFSHNLLFCDKYTCSNIEVNDLYDGMIMSEDETIKILFRK